MQSPPRHSTPSRANRVLLLFAALGLMATLLAPAPASAEGGATWDVRRLAGEDESVLSAAVSNLAVVDADAVVIARGDTYPDALAGAPLAALMDAPILMTDRDDLPTHIYTEVDRLRPTTVVLLGGTEALSPAIESILRDRLAIQDVRRIGGANRFETAALIASEVVARGGADDAYLVRGEHPDPVRAWPDAVAVSALAARQGRPILLAGDTAVPDATLDALAQLSVRDVTVIGGSAAVSHEAAAQVADAGHTVLRIAGDTRFTTSLAVAEAAMADGARDTDIWLVSGGQFADALVSSVAVDRADGLMLIIDGSNWVGSDAQRFVHERSDRVRDLTVVGSLDSIPADVDRELVVSRTGRPAPTPTEGGVRVEVGQSLQGVVDAHPPGTHFVIASGVHRLQSVVPRSGDRFTGEPGAVLNGAIELPADGFVQLPDGRWSSPAPPIAETPLNPIWEIEPGFERQAYPNDLWAGHVRVQHVNSLDQVNRPRTWFHDFATDRVIMHDDPRAVGPIELSVTDVAFEARYGQATRDVTISDLTITRYANLPTRGAVEASAGHFWTVSQVEIIENHAAGLKVGPGMLVERSRFIRNGQMGIGGTDVDLASGFTAPVVVTDNEVAHNGELRFVWAWEAGSIKFGATTGLVMRRNWVHSHRGPGPWFDVDSLDSVIDSNLVEFNMINGVMYEISRAAVIRGNTIRNNGVLAVGDLGAGLWISNSAGVLIEGNTLEGNRLPINAQSSPVEEGRSGERIVQDLLVRDNDMRIDYLAPGLRVTSDDDFLYREGNNRFEGNTYRLRPESDRNFFWGSFFTIERWQSELGHDRDGRFLDLLAPPSTRATATPISAIGQP
jgi:putative cell wall-binding protein